MSTSETGGLVLAAMKGSQSKTKQVREKVTGSDGRHAAPGPESPGPPQSRRWTVEFRHLREGASLNRES
jgi:hypothetical protein